MKVCSKGSNSLIPLSWIKRWIHPRTLTASAWQTNFSIGPVVTLSVTAKIRLRSSWKSYTLAVCFRGWRHSATLAARSPDMQLLCPELPATGWCRGNHAGPYYPHQICAVRDAEQDTRQWPHVTQRRSRVGGHLASFAATTSAAHQWQHHLLSGKCWSSWCQHHYYAFLGA